MGLENIFTQWRIVLKLISSFLIEICNSSVDFSKNEIPLCCSLNYSGLIFSSANDRYNFQNI